ncbi:MAG: LuxR C-terminal-related transcriptional regulator [Actinomycetota bacterium]
MAAPIPQALIGRDEHLARLRDIVDRADGEVVIVSGEPGVGKTRLVTEAIGDHRDGVLVGASSPASLGRPFDLLLSAVEPMVRTWTALPADLSALGGSLASLLRTVAPGLDMPGPLDGGPVASDQIGAGIALLRHLDPQLIVLEDLHWADVESLQVLERVVSSPAHPTLVVTYRPEDLTVGHPAVELLGVVEGRSAPVHLHLEPFGLDEVSEYVRQSIGDVWSDRVLAQLHARSGGSPFFLEQLICHAAASPADMHERALPWTLAETVRLATDDLAADERELLAMAAVLGSRFEFDLLQTALALDESELIDRLRRVVGRRLLVEHDTDEFTFRHELVRDSILESLLGRERRRLHDAAYDALEAQHPDDYAELARHAEGANCVENLLALAPKGVEHYLNTGSSYQALRLAEQALAEAPDHCRLRELAARAGWLAGKLDEGMRHAERWLAIEYQHGEGRSSDALILIGRLAFEQGDRERQRAVVDQLAERLAELGPDEERARVLAGLAQYHMLNGDDAEAVELAEQAIELATELGLDSIRRSATVELGTAVACLTDRVEEGREILARVGKESEAADDYVIAARAFHNLTSFLEPEDAEAAIGAMRDAAQRGGFESMAVHFYAFKRAELAMLRGDLKGALAWTVRARQLGRNTRASSELAVAEALLLVEADQADQAGVAIEAVGDAGFGSRFEGLPWVRMAEIVILARAGDGDEVRARLAGLADDDQLAPLVAWGLRDLLAGGLSTDEVLDLLAAAPDSEWRTLAELLTRSEADEPGALAEIDLILDGSDGLFLMGKHKVKPFPVAIDAELRIARAKLLLGTGDREAGRQSAEEAADRLCDWPGPRRDAALALVRATTVTTSGAGDELTGRELDVARLVARGLSNGAIADELYISRKTVSTHVSHILAKLGMASRTEVAAWAIREGIATD